MERAVDVLGACAGFPHGERKSPPTLFHQTPMSDRATGIPVFGMVDEAAHRSTRKRERELRRQRVRSSLRGVTLAASALALAAIGAPGSSRTSAAQEVPVTETYRRQCASCHGEEGRGDGRVARRYNPRPTDFRDPEGVAALSDEELLQIIAEGRGSMPAFDEVLPLEVLLDLVRHVRQLSMDSSGEHRGGDTGDGNAPAHR